MDREKKRRDAIKWNARCDEDAPLLLMDYLREIARAFQHDVVQEKQRYAAETTRINEASRDRLKQLLDARNQSGNQAQWDVKAGMDSARERYLAPADALGRDLEALRASYAPSGFQAFVQKLTLGSGEEAENAAYTGVQWARDQLSHAVDALQGALLNQQGLQGDQAKSAYDSAYQAEQRRVTEALSKAATSHRANLEQICQTYTNRIHAVATDQTVTDYIRRVAEAQPDTERYQPAGALPEFVSFGSIMMEICQLKNVEPEVANTMRAALRTVFVPGGDSALTAKLPYAQRPDGNLSLFLTYPSGSRERYQQYLRLILLRMFLSYPATRLEATLIDPIGLGKSLAMFTQLGEDRPEIIDTRIWTQRDDIRKQIRTLRDSLESIVQQFGDDQTARAELEPFHILAISDFPSGFDQQALDDLESIVSVGKDHGFFVFIWANADEVAKLNAQQTSLFNQIKEGMNLAAVDQGRVLLQTRSDAAVSFAFDPVGENYDQVLSGLKAEVEKTHRKSVGFAEILPGFNGADNWGKRDALNDLVIPIGVSGRHKVTQLSIGQAGGRTEHHIAIAGNIGSGKSQALHTIIMSILLSYSSDEVQLYLVDCKDGAEYKGYSRTKLPAVRVLAVDCEPEFGQSILTELVKEMDRRYVMFQREASCADYPSYRRKTGKKLPRLLLVVDEMQELFKQGNPNAAKECVECLRRLLVQGRASGIHVIISSQDFNLIPEVKALLGFARIRIALQGDRSSAESVLGSKNQGAALLQNRDPGTAILNTEGGEESANALFRFAYLPEQERLELLKELSRTQCSALRAAGRDVPTMRILVSNVEDDIFNVYNRFIQDSYVEQRGDDPEQYCLMVGSRPDEKRLRTSLERKKGANLLMVGKRERTAASMTYLAMLSLLYAELGNPDMRKDNQLIQLVDLSDEEEFFSEENTSFAHIAGLFPWQITRERLGGMEQLIDGTYSALIRRMDGEEDSGERLVLILFGIDRAVKLKQGSIYASQTGENLSTLSKLAEIFRQGPRYGVNTIVWGATMQGLTGLLGQGFDQDFQRRIVFDSDAATYELVGENEPENVPAGMAVYMDIQNDIHNTHFRPFNIPVKNWVKTFADRYRDFEEGF